MNRSDDPSKPGMRIAPLPSRPSRRIQFGMKFMLLILSLGGPILASLALVPAEFYWMVTGLIVVAWVFVLAAFGASFLKPPWAASLAAISVLFLVLVHVGWFRNRLAMPEPIVNVIVIATWIQASAALAGFFISIARHAK